MKKKVKKNILIGALVSVLAVGGINVGIHAIGAVNEAKKKADTTPQTVEVTDDELRAYYVDGSGEGSCGNTTVDGVFPSSPNLHGVKASLANGDKLVMREVINLNDYETNEPIIKVHVAPEKLGEQECACIKIDLVDVYDESNYITVQIKPPNGQQDSGSCYVLACASNGQLPTGIYSDGVTIHVNAWGPWINWNFATEYFAPEEQFLGVGYDSETKQLYLHRHTGPHMMADFDDPLFYGDLLWDGFTTGEVYARIYAEDYVKSMANIVVSKYGNVDLSKKIIENEEGPRLTVDLNEYDEISIPQALVGKTYQLFDASAFDLYSGETQVDVNVYTNYYSSNRQAVVVNKRLKTFVPECEGEYFVEYSTQDAQGNKTVKVLQVSALLQTEDVSYDFGEYATTVVAGEQFTLPTYKVSGGAGKCDVVVSARNEGVELPIIDGKVRAVKSGKLEIRFDTTDYVGQTDSFTMEVTVLNATKPTFIEEPDLPLFFVEGQKYTLPKVNAYNYIDGNGVAIPTQLSILPKNGESVGTLDGYVYRPEAESEDEYAIVKYTATLNGVSEPLTYKIPVRKVKTDGKYDVTKYFETSEDVTMTPQKRSLDFTVNAENSLITFINPIVSLNASVNLKMGVNASKIKKFNIILTDYTDEKNQFKFTYDASGKVYVNDETSNALGWDGSFAEGVDFVWSYNDNLKTISYAVTAKIDANVKTTTSGKTFEGFGTKGYYLTFSVEGGEESMFSLTYINSNLFSNKESYVGPIISILGVYGGAANINEVVTIAKAISCDIQDGEVDVYLTVLDPTGNPVKDVNGVLLNEVVLTDADIQIKLTSYGFYLVRYKAMDNADEVSETTYAIIVPDTKKPVITISGELVKEAKVGDLIDVPSATATDNYDAEVDVKIYIATPTTEMIELEGDKKGFKAMATGEYRVIYRARDAEGNSMTIVNVIVVKEA